MDTAIERVSVGCQTEPNLIDKLIDNHVRKKLDDIDLYQEYVRSAQCAQFWPLDKNPIRSLVPTMLNVDLPEQYLKNESLMFDLVQAITNNSKLVNLLAKYIHHIVPNVIISKRIDLIPLITCTIRVCRDTNEQERLMSLLFNLIKRPNEEQRRMIISGIIVVLQISPDRSSSLLLPNLWDHVNDKFHERRILLAESCSTLAHYVRPIMRTNLILSILIQLLKDKNVLVRSAACKSFSCLLTLIMDRNDEVFDACLSATEDIIQDVLQQTPVSFCENRYELEQMRFCALETAYPLLCMWAVKLNRFKSEVADFYLAKAEKFFTTQISATNGQLASSRPESPGLPVANSSNNSGKILSSVGAAAKRRSLFFDNRSISFNQGANIKQEPQVSSSLFDRRRQSAFVAHPSSHFQNGTAVTSAAQLTSQRAVAAYLKLLDYLVPFVFADAVHSCAWLSKANLGLDQNNNNNNTESPVVNKDVNNNNNSGNTINNNNNSNCNDLNYDDALAKSSSTTSSTSPAPSTSSASRASFKDDVILREGFVHLFDRPLKFKNKLLNPTLIIDESAVVAFHDQLEQEHMIESLGWILEKFLPKFLACISYFSHKSFYLAIGGTNDIIQEFLSSSISSIRQLCLLFGRHLTRTKIRPLIKHSINTDNSISLYPIYIASLTSFEPIEQQEFDEIALTVRQNLSTPELTRGDVEILALSIKVISTNAEQIHSPSTRQKFLTYILDALVNYSNQIIKRPLGSGGGGQNNSSNSNNSSHQSNSSKAAKNADLQQQTQTKEFMLILFRHILTCLIDQTVRPTDWAHILVTKFLPLVISLANDSTDVHVCTYARLMCAQLVETFDTYLHAPELTKQSFNTMLPALNSLKGLTEQIKASNLRRQIECLTNELNERFLNEAVDQLGVKEVASASVAESQ